MVQSANRAAFPKGMSEDFHMDFIWDLIQQFQIEAQATKAASLEERVQALEKGLASIRQALLALFRELDRTSKAAPDEPDRADTFATLANAVRVAASKDAHTEPEPSSPDREQGSIPDDCCLECGAPMPEGISKCTSCGCTYETRGGNELETPPEDTSFREPARPTPPR